MESKNVYQRIVAVMNEVKMVVKEDKRVNNQYRFVSHDAVTKALHEPCVRHGLVIIPSIASFKQDGNRTEVVVSVTFTNADQPLDSFVTSSFGYGIDPQDKGPGKAYSYAFKMALLKTFMLESGEEDNEVAQIEHKPDKEEFKAAGAGFRKKPAVAEEGGF